MKKFTKIITTSVIVIMMLVLASLTLGSGLTAEAKKFDQLTVTGTTVDPKEYDGTLVATVKCGTLGGVIGSDSVYVSASAEFDDKNVGTGKRVTVTYNISGPDADSYLAPSSAVFYVDITPAILTVAGTMVDDKTYDGTTNAIVSAKGLLQGIIGGDNVEIDTATATFEDKNVDKYKMVTVSFTLKGDAAANYQVENSELSATIGKRSVTLTSADASKQYDGTPITNNNVSVTDDGFVTGEGATYDVIGSQTKVGDSPNAFDYTLNEGTSAGNYDITSVWGTLTVTPNSTAITLTANSCAKTHDGTALADNGYVVTGALAEGDYFESVTVTGSITEVGSTANTFTGYVIKNPAGEDITTFYTNIQLVNGILTIKPEPVKLVASGATVANKKYDGTSSAVVTKVIIENIAQGDNVTVSSTATFDTKDAGTGKTVTIKYTISGPDAEKYIAPDDTVLTANITKREIVFTSGDASKKYDETPLTNSNVTTTGDGFVGEEGATLDVTGSQTNVGSAPNTFEFTLNVGTSAGNYSISTANGTLTVTPCDTEITIIANSSSKTVDGTALADNGYTYTGELLPGHYFASVTVTGSITEVGTTNNMVTGFVIKNQAGEDVTDFYSGITTIDGTLTIEAEPVSPVTGDASRIGQFIVLVAVSLAAIGFVAPVIRKKTTI